MNIKSKVTKLSVAVGLWALLLASVVCAESPEELRKLRPDELQKIEQAVPSKATAAAKKPRKILVFWLCKGYFHEVIPVANAAFRLMGEKTGAFETVFSDDMAMFDAERLNKFDAVLFNNTTRLGFEDKARRQALMDFVKAGKGIIGIHAATDNFYNWPEAAEMIGGVFDGHPWGAGGVWAVKLDEPEHPLNKGFEGKGFLIRDEIYQFKQPYSRDNLRVLLSLDMQDERNLKTGGRGAYGTMHRKDNDYAISWIRKFGQGRVFYCGLGHNNEVFLNKAVLQHYLDGIQYALGDLAAEATPGSPAAAVIPDADTSRLNAILKKVAVYEYGQSREALTELSDFIRERYDSPEALKVIEKHLLELLESEATAAGKQFVCRKLRIIGTQQSVGTLAAMLTEASTADMARYALENIPGTAVDEALREALTKASGKEKIGIINTLGVRADRQSVPALKALVYDWDQTIAMAAASALGQIGDAGAAEALAQAQQKTGGKVKQVVQDSYLNCADKLAGEGKKEQASAIYRQLYAADNSTIIRIAALRGIVATTAAEATETVLEALKGKDEALQSAAIGLVRDVPGAEVIKAVTSELPNLSVSGQVQLLSALADRQDKSALPAVRAATESTDESVRAAALKALGQLGDESSVNLLARRAAAAGGTEKKIARESLYRLRGDNVDTTILANIGSAEGEVKVELLRSIGRRDISGAVETLLETAKDSDRQVRLESIKALKSVAGGQDLEKLVGLLISLRDPVECSEAERTVVAVSAKIADENRRSEAVLDALGSAKDAEAQCSLLSVLGKIGVSSGLGALRSSLEDSDVKVREAGIRALSQWPNAEPAGDLLKFVQRSDNQIHRTLALRAFVHLVGLESDRPAIATMEMYKTAMSLASTAESKKLILSGVGKVESPEALQMAGDYLDDKELCEEAAAAAVRIAKAIYKEHPKQVGKSMQQVLKVAISHSVRAQAEKVLSGVNKD